MNEIFFISVHCISTYVLHGIGWDQCNVPAQCHEIFHENILIWCHASLAWSWVPRWYTICIAMHWNARFKHFYWCCRSLKHLGRERILEWQMEENSQWEIRDKEHCTCMTWKPVSSEHERDLHHLIKWSRRCWVTKWGGSSPKRFIRACLNLEGGRTPLTDLRSIWG